MIRYEIAYEQIEKAVELQKPNWLKQAQLRTDELKRKKKFDEVSSIWGEVKPIYMHFQNRKCIFCERQLEGTEYGTIEHDLEHFRPKSSVKAWPPKKLQTEYDFDLGKESENGYYWLAYELMNYAACCKVCNTPLKSNFFPIRGKRKTSPAALETLKSEKPFLCYPIGKLDDDPEDIVTFIATTAVPAKKSGHTAKRGRVIIDFFQLNKREQLHRERAMYVTFLGNSLAELEAGNNVEKNQQIVDILLSSSKPHAGCSRAFNRLWIADNPQARKVHQACFEYFVSQESKIPTI